MVDSSLTKGECRSILSLASIYAFRMLGLFMILPIFVLYAGSFSNSSAFLVGLAIGAYGLTQAIFQIPFGLLSDRWGRKPMIGLGLLLFAIGSIVAAYSDSIIGIIAGRGLQGTGAIGCVLLAFVSDLTREQVRARAMGLIGMIIGSSFAIALVLGPLLSQWIGIQGIFLLMAAFALLGLGILMFGVPTEPPSTSITSTLVNWRMLITDRRLLSLDWGILCLHASLAALFLVVPSLLRDCQFPEKNLWWFYLGVLLVSVVFTMPLIVRGERRQRLPVLMLVAILMLVCAELALCYFSDRLIGIAISLAVFFTAFNILEAMLPALVSSFAPKSYKGGALGIFSTLQFLGIFIGGSLGGWLYSQYGRIAVMLLCILLACSWLALVFTMASRSSVENRTNLDIPVKAQ